MRKSATSGGCWSSTSLTRKSATPRSVSAKSRRNPPGSSRSAERQRGEMQPGRPTFGELAQPSEVRFADLDVQALEQGARPRSGRSPAPGRGSRGPDPGPGAAPTGTAGRAECRARAGRPRQRTDERRQRHRRCTGEMEVVDHDDGVSQQPAIGGQAGGRVDALGAVGRRDEPARCHRRQAAARWRRPRVPTRTAPGRHRWDRTPSTPSSPSARRAHDRRAAPSCPSRSTRRRPSTAHRRARADRRARVAAHGRAAVPEPRTVPAR